MKKLLISAIALFALAPSAEALQPGVFYGTLWFSSATPGCWIDNGKFQMLYQPANIGGNAPAATFQLASAGGGIYAYMTRYIVPGGGDIGATFTAMDGTTIGGGDAHTFTASVRITKQQPATITVDTHDLHLVGDIKNFDGAACTGHFDATLNSYPIP